jgi:hypothetical protein
MLKYLLYIVSIFNDFMLNFSTTYFSRFLPKRARMYWSRPSSYENAMQSVWHRSVEGSLNKNFQLYKIAFPSPNTTAKSDEILQYRPLYRIGRVQPQEARYIEWWPCHPIDISLLAGLVTGRRLQCAAGAEWQGMYSIHSPLDYQICSSQPRQKSCWAISLRI